MDFSRMETLVGEQGIQKLNKCVVLVKGFKGASAEIVKNLVLSGVGNVIVDHCEEKTTWDDLSVNFFASEHDVGKFPSIKKFSELNPYVKVMERRVSVANLPDVIPEGGVVVLVGRPFSEVEDISNKARTHNFKLVVVNTYGLCGSITIDFGPSYCFTKSPGKEFLDLKVEHISPTGTVTLVDEVQQEVHRLFEGAHVVFYGVEGMEGFNGRPFEILEVDTKTLNIGDTTAYGSYLQGGFARRHLTKHAIEHDPVEELFTRHRLYNGDPELTHLAICEKVLYQFSTSLGYEFDERREDHVAKFMLRFNELLDKANHSARKKIDLDTSVLKQFLATKRGQTSAIATCIGGIASQEVLKACLQLYQPGFSNFVEEQQFYFSALKWVLPESHVPTLDNSDSSRYLGDIRIFGKLHQKITAATPFIVGAGALGCEILKTFALMGVGTGSGSSMIHVTDGDTIAQSNLHRQFLYQHTNIERYKSHTAADEIRRINPEVRAKSYTELLSYQSYLEKFDHQFFQGVNCIISAVDNVQARQFMSLLSKMYTIPVFDSGTGGLSCSTQVYIPGVTKDMVIPTKDPVKDQAGCFTKGKPYLTEHAIIIATELFSQVFLTDVTKLNELEYLMINSMVDEGVALLKLAQEGETSSLRKYCNYILTGVNKEIGGTTTESQLQGKFVDSLSACLQQLFKHKMPLPTLSFDKDNTDHLDFIFSCASLLCERFKLSPPTLSKVRYIAGDMSTAIVTSSALATSFLALNFMANAINGSTVKHLRFASFDLALASLSLSQMLPAASPSPSKFLVFGNIHGMTVKDFCLQVGMQTGYKVYKVSMKHGLHGEEYFYDDDRRTAVSLKLQHKSLEDLVVQFFEKGTPENFLLHVEFENPIETWAVKCHIQAPSATSTSQAP